MKSIYIAGPYTSEDGEVGEDRNIYEAAKVASDYLVKGWAVFCPHTMSCYIDRNFTNKKFADKGQKIATWEDWLIMDLHWISKCDAIHMLPGWRNSKGATLEYMVAKALGLEILGDVDSFGDEVSFEDTAVSDFLDIEFTSPVATLLRKYLFE